MLRFLAILAVIAAFSAAGPAEAHVGLVDRAVFEAPQPPAPAQPTGHDVLVADDRTNPPVGIVIAGLLLAVSLARRRPRRPVVAALALLVAVLGLESAVHSVHHGDEPVACATASAAAHLDGTTVALVALDAPILWIGAIVASFDPLCVALRSLDPSHPRAPPAPLV
ncbi:MAG TPA: hypothetical protein VJZ73_20645 [Methylomirabilota bacterium]|nr:hypothetical protein [Methylomirabilota bacterium]